MKPRRLTDKSSREQARHTRNRQWRFMERVRECGTLWFCLWNKKRLPEAADEWRDGLIGGMELVEWMGKHAEWFIRGDWDDERYAEPVQLTADGLQALDHRDLYDMEDVEGGLVDPGFIVTPLPQSEMAEAADG